MKMLIWGAARNEYGADQVATWPKEVPDAMLSERQAQANHYQSLQKLNERGGLSPSEMLAVMERRPWARMDENEAARKIAEKLAAA